MKAAAIFAKRLKQMRKEMGLTQKEMAELVGITQANICAYECGRNVPGLQSLLNIAQNCNVSLDWLCGMNNGSLMKNVTHFTDCLSNCGAVRFDFDIRITDYTAKVRQKINEEL